MEFAGKVAVLTASGGGIGRACAVALAEAGMRIVVADIDDAGADITVQMVRDLGAEAIAIHTDVTSDESVRALAERTVEQYGQVDLLHNHAGIAVAGVLEDIPAGEWLRVFEFNVLSQLRGVLTFLPLLEESKGHIVNTTSGLGVVAGHPISAMMGPYITSKAAIVSWTQCLAESMRPRGVGVSLLAPDYTATNFDRTVKFHGVPVEGGDAAAAAIAEKSFDIQTPDLVARALVQGLRSNDFLICPMPDVASKLRVQAEGLLDPAALHDVY